MADRKPMPTIPSVGEFDENRKRDAPKYLQLERPIDEKRKIRHEKGRLLLSNIGDNITEDDIKKRFEDCGGAEYVDIHVSKFNGLKTGTAEVWMKNGNAAENVKRINGCNVFNDGRLIRIESPFILTPAYWKCVFDTQKVKVKAAKKDK